MEGLTKDFAIVGECDLIYRGGSSVAIEVTLQNGSTVVSNVYMDDFKGTVRIRLPSERI